MTQCPTISRREATFWIVAVFAMAGATSLLSMAMRAQLSWPGDHLMSPDAYVGLVTIHGTLGVFFFLLPALFCALGALRRYGGRRAVVAAILFALASAGIIAASIAGPPMSGWAAVVPLALDPGRASGSGVAQTIWFTSVACVCAAIALSASRELREPATLSRWAAGAAVVSCALLLALFAAAAVFRAGFASDTGVAWFTALQRLGYRGLELAVLAASIACARGALGIADGGARGLRPWFLIAIAVLFRELTVLGRPAVLEIIASAWILIVIAREWRSAFGIALERRAAGVWLGLATLGFAALAIIAGVYGESPLAILPAQGTYFGPAAFHLVYAIAGWLGFLAGLDAAFARWCGRRLHGGLACLHLAATAPLALLFTAGLAWQGLAGRVRYAFDTGAGREIEPILSALAVLLALVQVLAAVNVIWSALAGDACGEEQSPNSAPSSD